MFLCLIKFFICNSHRVELSRRILIQSVELFWCLEVPVSLRHLVKQVVRLWLLLAEAYLSCR